MPREGHRMAIKKLGHVGIYAQDLPTMRQFYQDVVGLQVSDEDDGLGAVFMSSDPDDEHHQFALFRANGRTGSNVQQISFSCASLEDILDYYERFRRAHVKIDRVVTHGNAVSIYFFDPEDNRCEVYWTTPWKAKQPFAYGIDLTRPKGEVLEQVEQLAKQYGATGVRSPESFKGQKERLLEQGFRVA
jgi:catechol-2,3-dioxygenase